MISVKNVTKKFDNFTVLDGISVDIADACVYGLVGVNGAGKSTLLRLLSGVYKQDAGDILYDGAPVYENPNVKRRIAFVSDGLYFLPQSSLRDMAQFYKAVYSDFSFERFDSLIKEFDLSKKAAIRTFSKGMKRQAATVLALSAMPKYLLLDETFDGLDPLTRQKFKRIIFDDVLERQTTIVVTSHSMRELEDTCDRVAMLKDRKLLFEDDLSKVKTSAIKVQIAFSDVYDRSRFEGFDLRSYTQKGSVAEFIAVGDAHEIERKLRETQPILLDTLPMTLEEIFVLSEEEGTKK